MVITFVTISSLLVLETIEKFSQIFFVCWATQDNHHLWFFLILQKNILGESSFIFPPSFLPAKPIASARLPRYEIRQWKIVMNASAFCVLRAIWELSPDGDYWKENLLEVCLLEWCIRGGAAILPSQHGYDVGDASGLFNIDRVQLFQPYGEDRDH